MPRDSSGNYSLPPGNPVVGGTTITPTWANPTMADIGTELTNSLDRNGRGGMLAPFKFADGAVGAPGMTWNSEPTSGFYRAGGNDMRAVIAGVPRMRWTATGVDVWDSVGSAWVTLFGVGTGYALLNSPNTFTVASTNTFNGAAFFAGPNLNHITTGVGIGVDVSPKLTFGLASGAANEKSWDMYASTTFGIRAVNDAGTDARWGLAITRTGYAISNVSLGNALDNPSYNFLGTGGITFGGQIVGNGSGGSGSVRLSSISPSLVLTETDAPADTQNWRIRANGNALTIAAINDALSAQSDILIATRTGLAVTQIRFGGTTDNPPYSFLGTGSATFGGPLLTTDGAVGAPSIAFALDPDTGFYRTSANEIRVGTGGVLAALFNAATRNYLGGAPYTTFADGSASFPAIGFELDQDTGIMRPGNDNLRIVAGATNICGFAFAGGAVIQPFGPIQSVIDGTVGTPNYSWNNDPNTGLFSAGADQIGVSTGGVMRAGFGITYGSGAGAVAAQAASTSSYAANFQGAGVGTTIGINTNLRLVSSAAARATGGIVFTDGVTWNSFIDAESAGAIAFSVSGTGALAVRLRIETGGQLGISDGVVGTPGLGFISDPDTGLYRAGANALMIVAGGAQGLQISYGGVVTQASFGSGNVTNPGITFLADNNKGFWHSGANRIAVSIAGLSVAEFLPASSGGMTTVDFAGTVQLVGYRGVPVSATATTLVLGDLGKCVPITANIAIPVSVFGPGDAVSIYNDTAGALSITQAAGTLRLAGTTTTGTRTLAARGMATIWFRSGGATPEVICSGNVT